MSNENSHEQAIAGEFVAQINAQRRLLIEAGALLSDMKDNPDAVRLSGMIRAQINDHVELHDAIVKLCEE